MWTSLFRWLISTAAGGVVSQYASEYFNRGFQSLIQGGLRLEQEESMRIIDVLEGTGGGGSTTWGGLGPAKKKRRRRARLTMSELQELVQIKNILGKTAAANVLPYYMGRGR